MIVPTLIIVAGLAILVPVSWECIRERRERQMAARYVEPRRWAEDCNQT